MLNQRRSFTENILLDAFRQVVWNHSTPARAALLTRMFLVITRVVLLKKHGNAPKNLPFVRLFDVWRCTQEIWKKTYFQVRLLWKSMGTPFSPFPALV